jgi:hypothetical protein
MTSMRWMIAMPVAPSAKRIRIWFCEDVRLAEGIVQLVLEFVVPQKLPSVHDWDVFRLFVVL